ncbi:hypothetical protein Acsp04_49320 [Actinomadura sp. NBRC 104425]|uniref:helix-turn-helix domain-containing protein n=1 Tax=Actinomadura sp. NBRC 104425 TaxID=3032204 RepID=UPI0024A1C682|nr:helix-turn-helix domain-containing protein [Actinomadura sp. NBRC 104425]GLZ14697.1 hypothetical protein Acsp04_49320 [Actinomadura sp. NBRC 104425]
MRDIDPADPELSVGQRVRYFRRRRGMSREILGGLVGKSARWVKAVERGEIRELKLPTVLSLAEALRLRDIAQLTGGRPLPTSMFRGPGHPARPRPAAPWAPAPAPTSARPRPRPAPRPPAPPAPPR